MILIICDGKATLNESLISSRQKVISQIATAVYSTRAVTKRRFDLWWLIAINSCFQSIMVDFIGSDCPLLNPGSHKAPFRPMMTEYLLSCFQLIMVYFFGNDCPLLHPGSHDASFRPMMTECLLSCFQLIMVDFTGSDCLLLHPGSLETPFRP